MNSDHPSPRLSSPEIKVTALSIDRHTKSRQPPRATAAAGFTLLELLVVIVIIGIMSSFAVLSTGLTGRDKPLDKESQRVLALMRMASEEAVMQTEELGLAIGNDGYLFLRYAENAWQPLEDDLFRERSLPDDVTLELVLEGRPIVLEDPTPPDDDVNANADEKDKAEKPKPPQILFLSSGEVSPFALTLHEHPGTAQRVITSDGNGGFTFDAGKDAGK